MTSYIWRLQAVGFLVCVLGINSGCTSRPSENTSTKVDNNKQQAKELLSSPQGEASPRPETGMAGRAILRQRLVSVNSDVLSSIPHTDSGELTTFDTPDNTRTVSFNLFEDLNATGLVETFERNTAGTLIWTGSLQNIPEGKFTLASHEGAVTAHITFPDGDYYILPSQSGHSVVQAGVGTEFKCKVKNDRAETKEAMAVAETELRPENERLLRDTAPLNRDDGKTIDVLVVYTAEAKKHAGGANQITSMVGVSERETNDAFKNSGIDLRIRVVRIAETSFKETLSEADDTSDKDLTKVAEGNEGKEIRDLRDTHGADQVTLVRVRGDLEGTAYLLNSLNQNVTQYPFNSIRINNVTYKYNFTHELGHNLGCHHNGKVGLFQYSSGYNFLVPKDTGTGTIRVGTLLDYGAANNRILYFSSPDILYKGKPTGEPALLPNGKVNPNSADNARTIRESKLYVANYRQSKP